MPFNWVSEYSPSTLFAEDVRRSGSFACEENRSELTSYMCELTESQELRLNKSRVTGF